MTVTILGTTEEEGTGRMHVLVSTPDFRQAVVVVPKAVAESKFLIPVLERALQSRQSTLDALQPVEE